MGGLLVLGAFLVLGLLVAVLQLPRFEQTGHSVFILPGTGGRHVLSGGVVPVLAAAGALLAVPGVLALWMAHVAPGFRLPARRPRGGRPTRRPLLVLVGGVVVLLLALMVRRWG